MPELLLEKIHFQVDDRFDFIDIKFGSLLSARIGYRLCFVIEQNLRIAAKQAAQFDNAPASFWRDVDVIDLEDDKYTPSRVPQQSQLSPSLPPGSKWEVQVNPPLVRLVLHDMAAEMDYETAVKFGHAIRRAARRAKAWAGDTSSHSRMAGYLTNSNEPLLKVS